MTGPLEGLDPDVVEKVTRLNTVALNSHRPA